MERAKSLHGGGLSRYPMLYIREGCNTMFLVNQGKVIWTYAIKTPWAAIRLHNGNTPITDEGDKLTREVNPKGETVWETKLSESPPECRLANSQS